MKSTIFNEKPPGLPTVEVTTEGSSFSDNDHLKVQVIEDNGAIAGGRPHYAP